MKWKAYPGYKPSGVEWLGEVPNSWPVTRLRFRAKINPSKAEINGVSGDTMVSFIPMEAVGEYGGLRLDQTKLLDEVANGYTYFREGDVVVAKITPCFENWKGSVAQGLENGLGFGTTELHVIRLADDLDRRYLFYLTITHAFRSVGASYMYGAGGQKRVPDDFIRNFRHPFPPSDEQRAIAAFLDRETGRIDALMEKKQRQVELLQEKRAALISHAVTKGLNPAAPLKSSGVEWIRQIPVHWELKRLKFLASEPLKYGANESAEIDDPDLPRYIRITDITEGGSLRDETFKSLAEDIAEPFILKNGDILLARSGATAGKTFMYQDSWGRACYAGYLIRLRANSLEAIPEFLYYFSNSSVYWGWLSSVFIQATIQNVSAEKYANMVVVTPPIEEQKEIVSFLDRETGKIDAHTAKIQESIDRLKEYRTALISAAVTGKIDVREAGT